MYSHISSVFSSQCISLKLFFFLHVYFFTLILNNYLETLHVIFWLIWLITQKQFVSRLLAELNINYVIYVAAASMDNCLDGDAITIIMPNSY